MGVTQSAVSHVLAQGLEQKNQALTVSSLRAFQVTIYLWGTERTDLSSYVHCQPPAMNLGT